MPPDTLFARGRRRSSGRRSACFGAAAASGRRASRYQRRRTVAAELAVLEFPARSRAETLIVYRPAFGGRQPNECGPLATDTTARCVNEPRVTTSVTVPGLSIVKRTRAPRPARATVCWRGDLTTGGVLRSRGKRDANLQKGSSGCLLRCRRGQRVCQEARPPAVGCG